MLTNIHAFAEKGRKWAKIGSKLSVKLTAQQTVLKNKIYVENLMPVEKIRNLTKLTYFIYFNILSNTKWINGCSFTINVATSTSSFWRCIFLLRPLAFKSKEKALKKLLELFYFL